MNHVLKSLLIIALLIIIGCTNINTTPTIYTNAGCKWGIATFTNNTEVPQAGNRAMSVTSGILRTKGARTILIYPSSANCNKLIICPNATVPLEAALKWARHNHITYVVMGAVNEWDYKVGLDGEPAAAISLQVYNAKSGQIIWSAVGSKIGTSRSGLGVTAQALIIQMLRSLQIM